MILASITQTERYSGLHPLFRCVFDYLRNTNLLSLAMGRHPILGEDVFVIMEQVQGRTREKAQLEAHRRYIDIQLVLEGDEQMGWKPLADCLDPVQDHDGDRDIRFFRDAPASWVTVPPGHFCIFFPEDAHAPLVGDGQVRKVIFKVAVNPA